MLNPATGLLEIAGICQQACLMEATARKPGNVHPQARFDDLCYEDFVLSAQWASPPLARAATDGVGSAVQDAIRATREHVGTNTNLGIALLIAPLAAVPGNSTLAAGIEEVLRALTSEDAAGVYEAIQLAQPGGMGRVNSGDVADLPPPDLLWAMRQAADRDWIARQYATGFHDLLHTAVPLLVEWCPTADWETRVIRLHLELMSRWPDTLIARKCGVAMAEESAGRAAAVLDSGWPHTSVGQMSIREFDAWLRGDGHKRNPGTTADAVAATVFAALRDHQVTFPDWEWPQ